MATSSTLSQTQRYAAGALLAFALRQAQIHQRVLLGSHGLDEDADPDTAVISSADPDGRDLWTHESRGLLLPVLRFLEIDPKAWPGVEKTAAASDPKHHIGAFLRKVFEDEDDGEKAAADRSELEFALAKAVDTMAMSLENDVAPGDLFKEQVLGGGSNDDPEDDDEGSPGSARCSKDYRKMAVLYMLLSACVADVNMAEDGVGSPRIRKGYDARHRVALRLLATWLDVKWIKMEAIEIMVACSAMAAAKEEEQSSECVSPRSRWESWKRGGIIGAAALTGGTLMAISGGLAAPALAAGFSALIPTLHALVPVIGASGFAAMATAAGHTAGSVAVAASFGAAGAGLTGSKMAKRIGDVKEFEIKTMGENHNQGRLAVCIMVSGFAFNDDDFLKPWEGWETNLERYILQWETKHIIALSTAIQDFLASRVALELVREGAMQTILSGIISAFAWPGTIITAAEFIDSIWAIMIPGQIRLGKCWLKFCSRDCREAGLSLSSVFRLVRVSCSNAWRN
uniref:Uncharacterized protein n=1 Tax=Avena sativa TaxID=4498 RepID=A0ACD5U4W1_AVESA